MKCLIVANGTVEDYEWFKQEIKKHDYILSVDGGAEHLYKISHIPHGIVGDLDSLSEEMILYFQNKNVPFYRFVTRKDYTDTELAIKYVLDKNPSEITIVGGIGTRMDHSLANISLLIPLLHKGIYARVLNEYNEIIVSNKDIELDGEVGDILSIIPYSTKVEGVTLKGLEYPLYDATIDIGASIGISNRFIQPKAFISIKKGCLIIIRSKDKDA